MEVVSFFLFALFLLGPFLFSRRKELKGLGQTVSSTHQLVSIIVPARNEEDNIGKLLVSLKHIKEDCEVIVVDDQSEDQTQHIAESHGARVLSLREKPKEWSGKSYGLWMGSQYAEGEFFLFLDADTWLEDDLVEKLKGQYQQKAGALSVIPFHRTSSLVEGLSFLFNLITAMSSEAFALFNSQRECLVGPCLFVHRKDYWQVGGHQRVYHEVLENFALSRFFREEGILIRTYLGKGVLSTRMFPPRFFDIFYGWAKAFGRGGELTRLTVFFLIIVWLIQLTIAPFLFLSSFSLDTSFALSFFYGLNALYLFLSAKRLGSFSLFTSLIYPVPLLFFYLTFFSSKLGVFVASWKGRAIASGKGIFK